MVIASEHAAGSESRRLGLLRHLGRTTDNPHADGPQFQRVLQELGRRIDPTDKQAIRNAATLLVSQLFFAPLLAEARELPFGGSIGDGGRGEEVFGEQLDQRLADLIAGSAPGLTSQIEAKLAGRGGVGPEDSAADDAADGRPGDGVLQAADAPRGDGPHDDGTAARGVLPGANDGGRWPLLMKLLERVSPGGMGSIGADRAGVDARKVGQNK